MYSTTDEIFFDARYCSIGFFGMVQTNVYDSFFYDLIHNLLYCHLLPSSITF